MPEDVRARRPERGDRPTDRDVLRIGLLVDVAGVRDLASRIRRRPVDLGVRERLEGGQFEFGSEGVDARMAEKRDARVVWVWDGCVALERAVAVASDAAGEVFVVVEVLEDRADGFEVVIGQLDAARLCASV